MIALLLDANVLFSAAHRPDSAPGLLVDFATAGLVRAVTETVEWSAARIAAKDAPILAAAIDARCDWLVTGDRRDFGHLFGTMQRGVLVMPPAEALKRLVRPERTGG